MGWCPDTLDMFSAGSPKPLVLEGRVEEVCPRLTAASFDAVLCDPPYGLSFMSRGWDHSVPSPELWREVLRVAKPGAFLMAFGGTRLFHRTVCGIEDGGWEVRDTIAWMYGTGFPKSHDIGKSTEADEWQGYGTALKPAHEPICWAQKPFEAVSFSDKMLEIQHIAGGLLCLLISSVKSAESFFRCALQEQEGAFVSARLLAAVLTTQGLPERFEGMGMSSSPEVASMCWNIATSWRQASADLWTRASTSTIETEIEATTALKTLRSLASAITPESITRAVTLRVGSRSSATTAASSLNAKDHRSSMAEGRFAVDRVTSLLLSACCDVTIAASSIEPTIQAASSVLQSVTSPAVSSDVDPTPAYEPVCLAQNPREGTYAGNALEHGCGGLAIDASRIEIDAPIVTSRSVSFGDTGAALGGGDGKYTVSENTQGRWPANVILDEEAGAVLDAQSGPKMHSAGKARDGSAARVDDSYDATAFQLPPNRNMRRLGDTGGASRFFYCAKASRAEREAGLEHFGAATVSDGRDKAIDNAYQRGKTKRKNTHPTVKPIDLIRYLARMILPPERAAPRRILVPFSGSGSEMIGCMQAGWDEVIGIEMNPEYAAIARARIEHWHAAQG